MTDSLSLVSAQVSFLDPHLTLIHIPIELYTAFLPSILRLLFGEDHDQDAAAIPWSSRHDFLNVTITRVECSIICTNDLAERLFRETAGLYQDLGMRRDIEIGYEDYIAIQVDGQGLDAGQRVLELTSPLAMAGISIFFLTTYFSDYILVPTRSRHTVSKALEQRGFIFSKAADAFVSQLSPSSPLLSNKSSSPFSPPGSSGSMPSTPPAKDVSELQMRTFNKLKRKSIVPMVDPSLRLINCAGHRENDETSDGQLRNDLLQVLLATSSTTLQVSDSTSAHVNNGLGLRWPEAREAEVDASPDYSTRFLSITITSNEPISILLEHRLCDRLGASLLGGKDNEDTLVPITLDLRDLPMEATGIVCGLAGRLTQGLSTSKELEFGTGEGAGDVVDITFLSTAKAGTVLVKANELEKAVKALEYGMDVIAGDGS